MRHNLIVWEVIYGEAILAVVGRVNDCKCVYGVFVRGDVG
jgi:hypothetical protein